jgi:hypothetical protein
MLNNASMKEPWNRQFQLWALLVTFSFATLGSCAKPAPSMDSDRLLKPTAGIRGIFEDSKHNLWMADNGAGIYVYNGDTVVHFTAIHKLRDEDTEGNSLHRAFSIAEDKDGNFWFGTVYSGIWRYEPSETDPIGRGTFTNYDDEQGFPCQSVWTIYKTRSGELLFAAEDPGGVYRFNGKSFERAY